MTKKFKEAETNLETSKNLQTKNIAKLINLDDHIQRVNFQCIAKIYIIVKTQFFKSQISLFFQILSSYEESEKMESISDFKGAL